MLKKTFTGALLLILISPLSWAQERIISADAGMTELLQALGRSDQLIAKDVTSPAIKGRTDIANIGYHRNLSAEGLLSLQPSLVLGTTEMGPPAVISQLDKAGVSVLRLERALDAPRLLSNIRRLAQQLGTQEQATGLIAHVQSQLESLQKPALAGQNTLFLLDMDQNQLRIAGQGTAANAFIELLGGHNPTRFSNYQTLSMEALLALEPATIIVGSTSGKAEHSRLLERFPMLSYTPAARNGQLLNIPSASLVAGLSISAVEQAYQLQQQLHSLKTAEAH